MRHFLALVVYGSVAALSLAACSSDSDGGTPNSGGAASGGAAGGSSPAHCVGSYAQFTPAEFLARTEDDKACSDASDASSVCANDLPVIGGTCGKGCLGMGDDAAQAECVADCIQAELAKSKSNPLSEDCVACYTADVECARKNCLAMCGLNPMGDACRLCRIDNGCVEEFYTCSGLPRPGAPAGNGGEGGA